MPLLPQTHHASGNQIRNAADKARFKREGLQWLTKKTCPRTRRKLHKSRKPWPREKGAKTAKSDKDAKADAAKKKGPGLGKRIAKYFRDVKGEFKKIIWPTLPTVVRNTGVTLAMCAVLGLVICVIDFGLGALVNLLVNAG